jgi:hypothetical protein
MSWWNAVLIVPPVLAAAEEPAGTESMIDDRRSPLTTAVPSAHMHWPEPFRPAEPGRRLAFWGLYRPRARGASSQRSDIIHQEVISEVAMIRTVVSLDAEGKRWLDAEAAREGVPMTELIRRAVRQLRRETERLAAFDAMLERTAGIGSGEDGLVVQRRLRDEWERHPA